VNRLGPTAILVVGSLAVATAQVRVVRDGDDRLAGITEVDVLVTLKDESERCGISRARLQSRSLDTLSCRGHQGHQQ
jgi:hypothetical protein